MVAISSEIMPFPTTDTRLSMPQEAHKHKSIFELLKLPVVKIINRLRLAAVRKELDQALDKDMREELAKLIVYDLKAGSTGKDETSVSRRQATGKEIVPQHSLLAIQKSLGIQGEEEIAAATDTQEVNEFIASAQGQLIVEIGGKLGPIFKEEDFFALSKVSDTAFKAFIHAGFMLDKAGEIFRNKQAPSADRIRASIVLRVAKSKQAAAREGIISMAMIVGVLKDEGSDALKAKLSELANFPRKDRDGLVNRIIELQNEFKANKPETLGIFYKALTIGASGAKSTGTPIPEPQPV